MKKTNRCFFILGAIILSFACCSAPALAGIILLPTVDISVVGTNSETDIKMSSSFRVPVENGGKYSAEDLSFGSENTMWSLDDLDVTGDIDPVVNLNYTLTNNASAPVEFVVDVTSPVIPPLTPASVYGGSIAGAVLGIDATISTTGGDPLFSGEFDGTPILALHPDSSSFGGPVGAVIPLASAGLPGPTLPGGPVLISLGITNRFVLSPGASVSLLNHFEAFEPIPEPSSLIMMILTSAMLVARRSRG